MRKPKRGFGDKRIGKKEAAFLAVMHGGIPRQADLNPQPKRPTKREDFNRHENEFWQEVEANEIPDYAGNFFDEILDDEAAK